MAFGESRRVAVAALLGLTVVASCSLDEEGSALEGLKSPTGGDSVSTGGLALPSGGIAPVAGDAAVTGGTSTGGLATGGVPAGGSTTGGMTTGGTATGGSPAGGGLWEGGTGAIATGGVAGGGEATGGVPTAGAPPGGAAGVPTGGMPTGGAPTGGAPCEEPEVWCETDSFSGCVELGSQEHCSGCGDACAEDESCVEDSDDDSEYGCECNTGLRCPEVDGACVDPLTDPENCGDCAVVCGANAECSEGLCGCTNPDYPDEHEGDCYDFATDEQNCGGFELACLPGEECVEQQCTCDAPLTLCPDETTPEACVDLDQDVENCGECGTRCAINGLCQDGDCVCQPDATLCHATEDDPGACAYTDEDPMYCGEDCLDCAAEVGIGAVCTVGVCECPAGYEICIDVETSDNVCVDRQTDENHCGRCGNACAPDGDCVEGVCIEHPCQDLCDNPARMAPERTVKPVGCYELFAADIPDATIARITGWDFDGDFNLTVNGEALPGFTDGGDHPLGDSRAGGWCIEVLSGSAVVYAPND